MRVPQDFYDGMPTFPKSANELRDLGGSPIKSREWTLPDVVAPQLDSRRVMMPVGNNNKPGPDGPKVYLITAVRAAPGIDNPRDIVAENSGPQPMWRAMVHNHWLVVSGLQEVPSDTYSWEGPSGMTDASGTVPVTRGDCT